MVTSHALFVSVNALIFAHDNCAKFQNNIKNTPVIMIGAKSDNRFFLVGLKNLSNKELSTTETELSAIASPANSGLRTNQNLANTPAAIGIPSTL